MYEKASDRYYAMFLSFVSKYIVWIVIVVVIAVWWFFPAYAEIFGKIALFWGPAIALICGFIFALVKQNFKIKRDQDQGIYQYNITLTKSDFYLMEAVIYLGTLVLLFIPYVINDFTVDIADLLQALTFFTITSWFKKMITKKILY